MNGTYTEWTNRWLDLTQETYHTYVRSLVWGQERALELTKVVTNQAETFQQQGRGLLSEYATQLERNQQLWQDFVRGAIQANGERFNDYRRATTQNLGL